MQQRSLSVFASVATSLWSSDASELERKLRPQAQYTASRAPTKEERNSNLISHLQNSRDVWRVRILFRDYGDIFRSYLHMDLALRCIRCRESRVAGRSLPLYIQ